MNQDLIEMARQAGLHVATDENWMPVINLKYLAKLVELATAKERERIIAENKPEIEKCNAYIKELEAHTQTAEWKLGASGVGGEGVCRMRIGQDSVTWYDPKGNVTMHVDSSNKVTVNSQPEQAQVESVGRVARMLGMTVGHLTKEVPIGTQLYTTPQQRTWVGLTPEEVFGLFGKFTAMTGKGWLALYRMAEAELKEKNK
jgi:hypothetical protein